MRSPFAGSPEFERLLRREARPDLTRIALEIVRDAYPDLEPGPYLERIEALAARVRDRAPAAAKGAAGPGADQLGPVRRGRVSGQHRGLLRPQEQLPQPGDRAQDGDPDQPLGALPGSGPPARPGDGGGQLPAHFMLRVDRGDETIFVDPFHAVALLDRQGCERRVAELVGRPVVLSDLELSPCGLDLVVTRMLRNLKAIYLRGHDFSTALPVQRRLAALNPDDPLEQADLGMLCLSSSTAPPTRSPPCSPSSTPAPNLRTPTRFCAFLLAARREVATWN